MCVRVVGSWCLRTQSSALIPTPTPQLCQSALARRGMEDGHAGPPARTTAGGVVRENGAVRWRGWTRVEVDSDTAKHRPSVRRAHGTD